MIAPNKQNLLLLKTTLKSQQNGHRLLKEKRSGLILSFLQLAKQGKKLESEISTNRQAILSSYLQSLNLVSPASINLSLDFQPVLELVSSKKKISGVSIIELTAKLNLPNRQNLRLPIQITLANFANLFPNLITLSQLKTSCQSLALEIKKVARQINNLEQKTNQTQLDLKFIKQALDERSNLEKATLIKTFS